ncbi:MAG: globin domain-containing protein [Alphaproteobacteria bacterium]
MTPSQLRIVRDTYTKIAPVATQVGEKFYDRLFSLAPETRKLFRDDMSYQHEKFMSVVAELVNLHLRSLLSLPATQMEDSEAAMPTIRKLGKEHADWGVIPAHFGLMRTSLMTTMHEFLGDQFTPQVREAWEEAFDIMAKVMKNGLLDTGPLMPDFVNRLADLDDDKPRCPVAHR